MTNDTNKSLISRERDPGFFRNLGNQLRIVLRLMADSRVNIPLKILPLATIVYLIVPDIVPGPVDDALVISLGLFTFVELCPKDVVEEHRAALGLSDSSSLDSADHGDTDG